MAGLMANLMPYLLGLGGFLGANARFVVARGLGAALGLVTLEAVRIVRYVSPDER